MAAVRRVVAGQFFHQSRNHIKAGHNLARLIMKRTMLLMIALIVLGCANHRQARRKSVRLYPGLPQREVVSLYGIPSKAEGNPDQDNQYRTEDELVWEYEKIDLAITFRHTQAGWVVKTWSID